MTHKYKYFKTEEYLKGRDKDHPLSKEQEDNMHKLLTILDKFREKYGKSLIISSGYRPEALNASVGGSKKSNHIMCLAVDFKDTDGKIDEWCLDNLHILTDLGLYLEDVNSTPGWCHLQCVAPKSKARVFLP